MDAFTKSQIVYEDNHILVVNKKPSQITQGDQTGDQSLGDMIKHFIKSRDNKPGNVYLGLVHRLDRPVSGLVIFAKTSKALTRLNKMIQKREIRKIYWAVVKNKPPKTEERLEHYLYKVAAKNKSYADEIPKGKAKKAELLYKHILSSDNYHLLEVELFTGRHHQIRVQLAKIGCIISGDVKYGFNRPNSYPFIHLHARKLEFIHPVSKQEIQLVADPPADALWNFFVTRITDE